MIVVDTGPLVAALDADDADHERCLDLLETHQGRLLVPGPVLTEVCWLLERERGTAAEAAFLEAIARGELELVAVTAADVQRMADLVRQYAQPAFGRGGRLSGRGSGTVGGRRGRNSGPSPLHGCATSARVLVRAVATPVAPQVGRYSHQYSQAGRQPAT